VAKVTEKTIDDFSLDDENANEGTKAGREMLLQSMQALRAGRSGLADSSRKMVAGNKSLVAARKAGITKVVEVETAGDEYVVVVRSDLNPEDPRRDEWEVLDNATAAAGLKWNAQKLKAKWKRGVDLSKAWNSEQLKQLFQIAEEEIKDIQSLDDVSEELPGAQALKVWMDFGSSNVMGIPDLKPDMLAECPEPIDIWAGPDASDESFEGSWLYCYGSDSMKGLDPSRAMLAFYVDDYRFENWFLQPDKYVSKMLNAGFLLAVEPNFSMWGADPLVLNLMQIFKRRWVGRYMQEAGVHVIPDIEIAAAECVKYSIMGIPKGAPCIAIEIHTQQLDKSRLNVLVNTAAWVLEELEPKSVLFYGGGVDLRLGFAGAVPDNIHAIWVTSRVTRRGNRAMSKVMGKAGE